MEENKTFNTIESLNTLANDTYLQLLKDNKLQEILKAMGKFPDYAIVNDVLVLAQMPEATKVLSKEEWEFKGRQLVESPRYINKISHCLYKLEQGNIDSRGTMYVVGTDKLTVKLSTVYDISQTTGQEFPEQIDIELLSKHFDIVKKSLEHTSKSYKFEYAEIEKNSIVDTTNKIITIKKGLTLREIITELLDRVSVVLLDNRKQEGITTNNKSNIKDIEYLAAQYAIHSRYGLELPTADFKEISKFKQEDMMLFKDNLQKIRSVVYQITKNLENSIDFALKGLDKQKDKQESQETKNVSKNKQKQAENEVF